MPDKYNPNLTPLAKNLRKSMTKEERKLWYNYLRSYPVRFYRQKVLGQYIVDFYCAKAKVIIELDGSQHFEPEEMKKDEQRTAYLREFGLSVIRIPNNEVTKNFSGVCDYIDEIIQKKLSEQSPPGRPWRPTSPF